jgi:hypothetical protein
LQALYQFDRHLLPVYVGQQMDVFIEARDYSTNKDLENHPNAKGPSS